MNKKDKLREILLSKGFKEVEYKTLLGESELEYIPTNDRVDIIINENISIRTTNGDGRIRIESNEFDNDKFTFLDNYQDYWGGWFKNEININIDSIKKLRIKTFNRNEPSLGTYQMSYEKE